MRDIRDDLKERLSAIGQREQSLLKALDDLKLERKALSDLFDLEQRRYEAANAPTVLPGTVLSYGYRRVRPIGDYLLELLESGPKTKDELREKAEAAGYFKGDEAAGRVLHATLMNLDRHGRLTIRPDGTYEKGQNDARQGTLVTIPGT